MSLISRIAAKNQRIVGRGLIFYLDAGNRASYPGTGNVWTDLVGSVNMDCKKVVPSDAQAIDPDNAVFDSANGGSLVFNAGSSGRFFLSASNPNISFARSTHIAWLKRDGLPNNWTGILMHRPYPDVSNQAAGMNFSNYTGNNQLFGYTWSKEGNNGDFAWTFNSNLFVPDQSWCMLALVVDTSYATLYMFTSSGVSFATNTLSSPTTHIAITPVNVLVGYDNIPGNFRLFKGNISICCIYNRTLSLSELKQNFNADRRRYGI
jgi:hypothetical protein